jgi:protease PrsW
MLELAVRAGDPTYSLALVFTTAILYIVLLRILDMNEKEPLWAIGTFFGLGVVVATFFYVVVDSTFLRLNLVEGAATIETAKFLTIALGMGIVGAIGRLRGWSEVNGALDGIVAGAAVGLGFATGATFVREFVVATPILDIGAGAGALFATVALLGLSEGLFGAIAGAAFGAAVYARGSLPRDALPFVGLAGAIVARIGYQYLRTGRSLSEIGVVLKWVALLLPVALIVAVIVVELARERRAIVAELADEAEAGVVTEEELALLRSFFARRGAYLRKIVAGDLNGWITLREMHNRQVQLAMTEARLRRAHGPDQQAELGAEVARLRAAILEFKQATGAGGTAAGATTAEAS